MVTNWCEFLYLIFFLFVKFISFALLWFSDFVFRTLPYQDARIERDLRASDWCHKVKSVWTNSNFFLVLLPFVFEFCFWRKIVSSSSASLFEFFFCRSFLGHMRVSIIVKCNLSAGKWRIMWILHVSSTYFLFSHSAFFDARGVLNGGGEKYSIEKLRKDALNRWKASRFGFFSSLVEEAFV